MSDNNDPFPVRQIEGAVQIPEPVDRKYRQALLNEAMKIGHPNVFDLMKKAVDKDPSSRAYEESLERFGESIYALCRMTAELVDELEFHHHGIKHWLDVTGFGNDPDMIEAMVAWVDAMKPPSVIH